MKQALILLVIIVTYSANTAAQNGNLRNHVDSEQLQQTSGSKEENPCVVFSKFKLDWFNIMGIRGGGDGQRLKLTFKNKSNKALKYVNIHYWAVNAVNDITTDRFNRKDFRVDCTGPFSPKKQTKLEVQIALFHPNLLKAYPYRIDITWMDGEEREIEINEDNISTIFPCLEYIAVGNIE